MNWYTQHRMDWIAETLRVFGNINRKHLVRKFGISAVQAANDFSRFQKLYPGVMEYDKHAKYYFLKEGTNDNHARPTRS